MASSATAPSMPVMSPTWSRIVSLPSVTTSSLSAERNSSAPAWPTLAAMLSFAVATAATWSNCSRVAPPSIGTSSDTSSSEASLVS